MHTHTADLHCDTTSPASPTARSVASSSPFTLEGKAMPRSARRLRTATDRAPVVETSVLTEASAQRTTPFTSESIVNPASEQKSSHSSLRDAASASGTSTGSSAAGLSRATKSATSFSTTSFRSLKRPRVRSNAAVNAACSAVLSAIVAASVHLERRPQQRDESEHSRWCEHHSETSLSPVSLNSPGEEITPSYSDNWLPIP
mmetsp:Transcript_60262/g.159273  ORF Transcript_60262/g.159273 Transcript_60262/m.159273 type:complete len:202 (-) Transcript_60262:838-1443(-)